ncbi:MAG: MmgE/PrpD family protein [Alphaproteobacteria bacterium]
MTETLAWLHAVDPMDDANVSGQARRLFLDTLGCMIAGLAKPELRDLATSLSAMDAGSVHLPGRPEGMTVSNAAFIAGIAACWDEACEGLARAHGRPGLHTFAAALPLALSGGRTLGEMLHALVDGYEIAGRMGETLRIRPGMHVDGVWGTFGAVAAAARLTGLSIGQTEMALEGAACHLPYSLYLPVREGATVRNTYVGEAAIRGLMQVSATKAGVTSPEGAIAVFQQLALNPDGSADIAAAPGEWFICQGYLKPFAAVRHVHYGVQAAIEWRQRNGDVRPSDIQSLDLAIYSEAMTYCGNRQPKTAIQAQFSLSYGLARAIAFGDLAPDAYTAEALVDPDVQRLEQMITITADDAIAEPGQRAATLTVGTNTGRETIQVDAMAGDPDRPLTDGDVAAKFVRYAGPVVGTSAATGLADRLLTAPLSANLSALMAL